MRLFPATSLVCVIDVQERLLAVIPEAERLVARVARLAAAAQILGVRRLLTEQYPKGLGATAPRLRPLLPPAEEKLSFSCAGCPGFDAAAAAGSGVSAIVVCGLETHVCVSQTVLDLLATGMTVFVAVDAVASRHRIDHDVALRRLEGAGAILTTTEAILFEWCRSADHPAFREIRTLVLERGGEDTTGRS
jgi:nicotinamidase-related amidase